MDRGSLTKDYGKRLLSLFVRIFFTDEDNDLFFYRFYSGFEEPHGLPFQDDFFFFFFGYLVFFRLGLVLVSVLFVVSE